MSRRKRSENDRISRRYHHRPVVEQLEDRMLLSVNIPSSANPVDAQQLLFGPALTREELLAVQAPPPGTPRLFRIAVDGASTPTPVQFNLDVINPSLTDAGLALYDADGNLLAAADADLTPNRPAREQLTVDLMPQQEYVLGVIMAANQPAEDFELLVTGAQKLNQAIALDPGNGKATFDAVGGEDAFNAPADVDYYPLILTNAGASGQVVVKPQGLDVDPYVTLFRRADAQSPWQAIDRDRAAVVGDPVILSLAPYVGENITDAEYLLAVAPGGFNTAGGAYQIEVAAPVLGKAEVPPLKPDEMLTPPPAEVGVGRLEVKDQSINTGESEFVGFRAPTTGTATFTVQTKGIGPLLSVYDETGQQLLAVASRNHPAPANQPLVLSLPVEAGAGYIVRLADVGGDDAGSVILTVDMPYTAAEVALTDPVTDLGILSVGPAEGGQYFRLETQPHIDLLVIEVAPADPAATDPIAPTVTLLGIDFPPVTYMAGPGQTLFIPIDIDSAGPFDLMVAGTQGSAPVVVKVGQLAIPKAIDLDALPGDSIDLLGDLAVSQTAGNFGSTGGVAFYQLVSEVVGETTTLTAQGTAQPLLAVYEEYGGQLHLLQWVLPSQAGTASVERELAVNRLHAVAALPLNLDSIGQPVNLTVDGPIQTGVGVGMVPFPAPKFPSDPDYDPSDLLNDPGPWEAQLNIRQVVLENEYQQHLWRTILPLNMKAGSSLTVTLDPEGMAGLTVEILRLDGTADGNVLATLTSLNGVTVTETLPVMDEFQGEILLFRVTVEPDQLDDGIYTLSMTVPTDNPHPFEVIEDYWGIDGDTVYHLANPFNEQSAKNQDFVENVGGITDIIQNQFGDSFHNAEFTSPEPYNPSSVHVYRFKAVGEGTLRVYTELLQEKVNTNLRVYRRVDAANGASYLKPILVDIMTGGGDFTPTSLLPSFDWFPANRTVLDAQTYVHNQIDLEVEPEEWYYVVVKNQEGSTGKYRLRIDAPNFAITDQGLVPPRFGGSDSVQVFGLGQDDEAVRYFAIQLPDYHNGTLVVTSQNSQGAWDFDLFSEAGGKIAGQVLDIPTGFSQFVTQGTFAVHEGPQTVYLRVKEQFLNPDAAAFTVGAVVEAPKGFAPPPTSLPSGPRERLGANAFGDGTAAGTMTAANEVKQFYFQSAGGPLTVTVKPDVPGAVTLLWGVYVDGQLMAWDQTTLSDNVNPRETLQTRLLLPGATYARTPTPADSDFAAAHERDLAFDISDYHDIVVYVKAVSTVKTAGFTVEVDSAADKVMRHHELFINPLDPSKSMLTPRGIITTPDDTFFLEDPALVTGQEWVRLSVPDGITGPVQLKLSRPQFDIVPTTVRYDVYAVDGTLVDSGTAIIPGGTLNNPFPKATIDLSVDVKGGAAYDVQVSRLGVPEASLVLKTSATFPSGKVTKPHPGVNDWDIPSDGFPRTAYVDPNGDFITTISQFASTPDKKQVAFESFWVGAAGKVEITATLSSNALTPYIALFRGRIGEAFNEFPNFVDLVLLDYVNVPRQGGTVYQMEAHLEPGLYALRVVRSNTTGLASVTLDVKAPTPRTEEIVLDPNFGYSDLLGLRVGDHARNAHLLGQAVENGEAPNNLVEAYRSRHYRVVAPAGSLAGLTGLGVATSGGSGFSDLDENRNAQLSVWRSQEDGSFIRNFLPDSIINPSHNASGNLQGHTAEVGPTSKAIPHEVFYLGLDRFGMANTIQLHSHVPVPFSGTPDLLVDPIDLSPGNGETKVGITIRNVGYAPAFKSAALYSTRDTSKADALQWYTAELNVPTLGPFGSNPRVLLWDPVMPADQVKVQADASLESTYLPIEELDETNNEQMRTLAEVDPHRPKVVSVELTDLLLDGTGPGDIYWGRYLAGVGGTEGKARVIVQDADGNDDLYQSFYLHPYSEIPYDIGDGTDNQFVVNFPGLAPTGSNPNEYVIYVEDRWGLESDEVIRKALIEPTPAWLDGNESYVKYNQGTHSYELTFHKTVVDYEKTTDQLLDAEGLPFIGDKKNRFLVEVHSEAVASLDPTQDVNPSTQTHVLLKVLGKDYINETYTNAVPETDHVGVVTDLVIDKKTLDLTTFKVGLVLDDLDLFHYQSPEIPLLAYGVPGVASINANLSFGLGATMDAGITLALDPDLEPLNLLGFASPTFLGPQMDLSATLSGEIEVLGFDIADLSGTVGLLIDIDFGLTSPTNVVVPIEQLAGNLGFEIGFSVYFSIEASIGPFTVWSFEPDPWEVGKAGDDVITWDEVDPSLQSLQSQQSQNSPMQMLQFGPNWDSKFNFQNMGQQPTADDIVVKKGNDLVGPLSIRPAPSLALDPQLGGGLYLEVIDAGAGKGNLAFAARDGDAWGPSVPLPQSEAVFSPVLAMTHDAPGTPAVVVYQVAAGLSDPASATVNQFLASQDIRYRYWDGASWGPEQSLGIEGYDFAPAVAFNAAGEGVLAWTHNAGAAPVGPDGHFDRAASEVMVAVWDPVTHTFSPPQGLTADGASSDSRPAVHVADDGTMTVAWLRDTQTANAVAFSQRVGGGWAAPGLLPILGQPEGGRITQLALGSAGADAAGKERLDVLFAHSRALPDGTAESKLFHRAATLDNFAAPAALATIAEKASFSHLRTLPHPDGGLVAYWQQSDGMSSEVFAAHLASPGPGGSTWTKPIRLTSGQDLEVAPSLSFDPGHNFQLVYEQRVPHGAQPGSPTLDPVIAGLSVSAGVGTSFLQAKPDLGFSSGLRFPATFHVASGTQVIGEATIINRGLVSTDVLVEYFRNGKPDKKLGEQTLKLGPGRTYDFVHAFPIQKGAQTFTVKLTALGFAQEAVGTQDNFSSASLTGITDLTVESLTLANPNVKGGQKTKLQALVRNLSSQNISKPVVVAFYTGDPSSPAFAGKLLGTKTLSALPAFGSKLVTLPWTVPAQGGDIVLTAVVDHAKTIKEATEFNNAARTTLSVHLDAALVSANSPAVQAILLNYSGKDNVLVQAEVRNFGKVDLHDVAVHLLWSREGSPYQTVEVTKLPLLPAGPKPVAINFQAPGLAGTNRYRVVVDPDEAMLDADRSNNAAGTKLFIQGLPDLIVGSIKPSTTSPKQGALLTLLVEIQNTGIDDADDVRVEVFARSASLGRRLVGKTTLGHIDPLSAAAVPIGVDTAQLQGDVELEVVIDRLEKILERSDRNNSASIRLEFGDDNAPRVYDVVDVTPDPREKPVSFIDVILSEPIDFTSFDVRDLVLTRDDERLALDEVTILCLSPTTYRVQGLERVTTADGDYVFSVLAAGILDLYGNAGIGSASDEWRMAGRSSAPPRGAQSALTGEQQKDVNRDEITDTIDEIFAGWEPSTL